MLKYRLLPAYRPNLGEPIPKRWRAVSKINQFSARHWTYGWCTNGNGGYHTARPRFSWPLKHLNQLARISCSGSVGPTRNANHTSVRHKHLDDLEREGHFYGI